MNDAKDFFNSANDRFSKIVTDDDYDGLVNTIYFLKQIRDRSDEINGMFAPVKVMFKYKFF